jgi:hypothetical protein
MKDDIIIHTREQWGAAAVAQNFARDSALGIVLHNMQNANRTPSSDPQKELQLSYQKSRDCQRQHIKDNGWSDTGQQFTISRGGVIMEGRKGSLDAAHGGRVCQGAHASGVNLFNRQYFGIELEGDFKTGFIATEAQKKALYNLCAHLRLWAGNPQEKDWKIVPHSEVLEGHTDCPRKLIEHMDEVRVAIRTRVNELLAIEHGAGGVAATGATVVGAGAGGAPPFGHAKVKSPDGTLNVRSAPKKSATKLRALNNGDVVGLYERNGAWNRISKDANEWVDGSFLVPSDPSAIPVVTPPPEASPIGEVVILPSSSADHHVSQVDTLYEVFYSDQAKKTLHRDVPLFRLTDRGGFFHRGSMQIDVDGSPRAYYPKDASPLRLDDISSADGAGGSTSYIQGKGKGKGPRPGFYVSATSLRFSQAVWDCDNFADAETVPYFVYPPGRNGVNKGDVGIIVHVPTMQWTAAIFGDSNDDRRVSEASLRVAVNLGRSKIHPTTLKVTGLSAYNGDDARNYFYLYFPGSTLAAAPNAPHWPEAAIKAAAEARFGAWGGIAMVKECLSHI